MYSAIHLYMVPDLCYPRPRVEAFGVLDLGIAEHCLPLLSKDQLNLSSAHHQLFLLHRWNVQVLAQCLRKYQRASSVLQSGVTVSGFGLLLAGAVGW